MADTRPNTTVTTSRYDAAGWPRYLNAAAGLWLFVSAFIWGHTGSEFANAWIVGAAMFFAALAALGAPGARFVNSVLAVWLLVSTLGMGGARATIWNHVIVAIVVFILSFLPNRTGNPQRPPAQHAA